MTNDAGAALSLAFRQGLGDAAPPPGPAELCGIEDEYRLLRHGRQVDFRGLIHSLPVPGRRLDPGDLNAYRLTSGLVLTCDDAEAELASPPVAVEAGFTTVLDGWAAEGLAQLRLLLPAGLELEGFSTHLSASVPDEIGIEAMRLFATTFAPALMLMLDAADSRGVYVRPRRGRLELCGEHVEGDYMRATAAFFAGAVRACASAIADDDQGALPSRLDVRLAPATSRYGVYVGRRLAFGFDLYEGGRNCALPLADGGTIGSQQHLEHAWQAARQALGDDCDAADVDVVEAIVRGDLPLRVERPAPLPAPGRLRAAPPASPFGSVLGLVATDGLALEAVAATWDYTVVRVALDGRQAYASIPRDSLASFVDGLAGATLAGALSDYVGSGPFGRGLVAHSQTAQADMWDDVRTAGLVAPERGPDGDYTASAMLKAGGRVGKLAARAGKAFARPGKTLGRPGKFVWPIRRRPRLVPPILPPRPAPEETLLATATATASAILAVEAAGRYRGPDRGGSHRCGCRCGRCVLGGRGAAGRHGHDDGDRDGDGHGNRLGEPDADGRPERNGSANSRGGCRDGDAEAFDRHAATADGDSATGPDAHRDAGLRPAGSGLYGDAYRDRRSVSNADSHGHTYAHSDTHADGHRNLRRPGRDLHADAADCAAMSQAASRDERLANSLCPRPAN